MKKLMLVVMIAACKDPSAVSRADTNRAEEFAVTVDAKSTCSRWGRSHDGDLDAALCKADDVLYYCTAGVTQRPRCDALVDLNAERREAAKQKAAAPVAPSAPVPSAAPSQEAGSAAPR